MSVSLTKDLSIPASRALGALVYLPGGIRVRVSAVHALPARSAKSPRVALIGRTTNGASVRVSVHPGAGLRPAQAI